MTFRMQSTPNARQVHVHVSTCLAVVDLRAPLCAALSVPRRNASLDRLQLYGGKEILMRAHFGLPSVASEDAAEASKWKKRSIQVAFEIPYFTVSGIQVRYLKILEKSGYAALPWVRYVTQAGDYTMALGRS